MGERSTIGGYQIVKRIGSGGMSTVYQAVDADGREVALKLLHPEVAADPASRERLRREVRMLQRVHGEYVAQILDAETEDYEVFIVTQLIDGPTLEADVRDSGRYERADLVELGEELAAALRSIHEVGVLHRDIKPSNVMMGADGPVLIDFGIAQLGDDLRMTRTGSLTHTPGWADPRVIRGASPDKKADWWALAAVLAYAATGTAPYKAETTPAVMHRVLSGEPRLPGLSSEVERAFRRALDPESPRRISFGELVEIIASSPDDAVRDAGDSGADATQPIGLETGQVTAPFGVDRTRMQTQPGPTYDRGRDQLSTRPYDLGAHSYGPPGSEQMPEAFGPNEPTTAEQPATNPSRTSVFDRPAAEPDFDPHTRELLPAGRPTQQGAQWDQAIAPFDPPPPQRLPDWIRPARKARLHVLLTGVIIAIFSLVWTVPAAIVFASLVVLVSMIGGASRGLKDRRVAHGGPYSGDVGGALIRLPLTLIGALARSAISLAVGGALAWATIAALKVFSLTQPELFEPIGLVVGMVVAWFISSNRNGREGARLLMEGIGPTPGYRLFWLAILLVVAMAAVIVVSQSGVNVI